MAINDGKGIFNPDGDQPIEIPPVSGNNTGGFNLNKLGINPPTDLGKDENAPQGFGNIPSAKDINIFAPKQPKISSIPDQIINGFNDSFGEHADTLNENMNNTLSKHTKGIRGLLAEFTKPNRQQNEFSPGQHKNSYNDINSLITNITSPMMKQISSMQQPMGTAGNLGNITQMGQQQAGTAAMVGGGMGGQGMSQPTPADVGGVPGQGDNKSEIEKFYDMFGLNSQGQKTPFSGMSSPNAFGNSMEQMQGSASDIVGSVVGFFKEAWQQISPILEEGLAQISKLVTGDEKTLPTAVHNATSAVTGAASSAAGSFAKGYTEGKQKPVDGLSSSNPRTPEPTTTAPSSPQTGNMGTPAAPSANRSLMPGGNAGTNSQQGNVSFDQKVAEVSQKLGIDDPNKLKAVMQFESRMNPAQKNQSVPPSGATGLIQFMPDTARDLGTTTDQLEKMSAVDQMDYVYKYYQEVAGKVNDINELAIATLAGKHSPALGKPDDYVLFKEGSLAYQQNEGLDKGLDGKKKHYITKGDYTARIRDIYQKGQFSTPAGEQPQEANAAPPSTSPNTSPVAPASLPSTADNSATPAISSPTGQDGMATTNAPNVDLSAGKGTSMADAAMSSVKPTSTVQDAEPTAPTQEAQLDRKDTMNNGPFTGLKDTLQTSLGSLADTFATTMGQHSQTLGNAVNMIHNVTTNNNSSSSSVGQGKNTAFDDMGISKELMGIITGDI